jgi:hypothetical protein
MRTKKKTGFWKIHQNCGTCQNKGKQYRNKMLIKEITKVNMTEIECFPDPSCRCCVCQGKFCRVNHPGHWHKNADLCECGGFKYKCDRYGCIKPATVGQKMGTED